MARLAYVLAASHSGSTLLAMILGAHPDVVTVGELKATSLGSADRYRCSCGVLIQQCAFWKRVTAEMSVKGHRFDITDARTNVLDLNSAYARRLLRPLHRGAALEAVRDAALSLSATWRRHLRETRERNLALIETVAHLSNAHLVVDSSKIGLRLKYLRGTPSLEIKVIRLIRDGRGVALTYMDPSAFADATAAERRSGGSGVQAGRQPKAATMRVAAREWKRSNEEADAVLASLPAQQVIEVRYEDMCLDPLQAMRAICTFVGVDPGRLRMNFRAVDQHVVGNGMRLDESPEVRLDQRWKTVLSASQLEEFDSIAGTLNRRYGYR